MNPQQLLYKIKEIESKIDNELLRMERQQMKAKKEFVRCADCRHAGKMGQLTVRCMTHGVGKVANARRMCEKFEHRESSGNDSGIKNQQVEQTKE